MAKQKISQAKEKERKLIEKIEQAKQELSRLQDKRKIEIGKLACKHGLDAFENSFLDKAFATLSKELANEHAS